jgi:hypothetical protein
MSLSSQDLGDLISLTSKELINRPRLQLDLVVGHNFSLLQKDLKPMMRVGATKNTIRNENFCFVFSNKVRCSPVGRETMLSILAPSWSFFDFTSMFHWVKVFQNVQTYLLAVKRPSKGLSNLINPSKLPQEAHVLPIPDLGILLQRQTGTQAPSHCLRHSRTDHGIQLRFSRWSIHDLR